MGCAWQQCLKEFDEEEVKTTSCKLKELLLPPDKLEPIETPDTITARDKKLALEQEELLQRLKEESKQKTRRKRNNKPESKEKRRKRRRYEREQKCPQQEVSVFNSQPRTKRGTEPSRLR